MIDQINIFNSLNWYFTLVKIVTVICSLPWFILAVPTIMSLAGHVPPGESLSKAMAFKLLWFAILCYPVIFFSLVLFAEKIAAQENLKVLGYFVALLPLIITLWGSHYLGFWKGKERVDIKNIKIEDIKVSGEKSISLLFKAIEIDDFETVKHFVENGIDVNVRGGFSGQTPIMEAIFLNRFGIACYFLDYGANLDVSDESGVHLARIVEVSRVKEGSKYWECWKKIYDALVEKKLMRFNILPKEYKKLGR